MGVFMNSEEQKVSYIIGRQLGEDFKKQNIEISFDDLFNGIKGAYNGEDSSLSPEETNEVMNAFQQRMHAAAMALQEAAMNENLKAGQAFLEKNAKEDGVQVTDSGLQYKVVNSGSGKTPGASDTVEVHYEGTLIDGTVFDSSYQRGQTISFPVNGVIPGWTEALQLMKEGDTWELAIPANLAYGEQGAGGAIGPNETLLFKVELISVK
jgi:FKBP-type peptidyl-prolyl cis-trans isomerase FklB